jgi:hypothetical protein
MHRVLRDEKQALRLCQLDQLLCVHFFVGRFAGVLHNLGPVLSTRMSRAATLEETPVASRLNL